MQAIWLKLLPICPRLVCMHFATLQGLLCLPHHLCEALLAAGLIVITLLLSYGLVEIPRFVWKTSEPEVRLRYCCHR